MKWLDDSPVRYANWRSRSDLHKARTDATKAVHIHANDTEWHTGNKGEELSVICQLAGEFMFVSVTPVVLFKSHCVTRHSI